MPQLPTFNSFSFFCKWEEIMEQLTDHSCSSSIDSSSHSPFFSSVAPSSSSSSSSSSLGVSSNNNNINNCSTKRDLSTDLRLGLSFSSPSTHKDDCSTSTRRDEGFDWPPIRPFLRSTLAEQQRHDEASLFVKVYMEGIPIGRKLDLYSHRDYNELVATLAHMFKTTIICPGSDGVHWTSEKHHVLTYEDKEGDMMMVGDVPWEMFLTTVKRLKITRADRC